MWEILKQKLKEHSSCRLSDSYETVSFEELLDFAENTSTGMRGTKKCAILCSRELNTAKALMLCFKERIAAIPMPLKYGAEACKKVAEATSFHMVITDNINNLKLLDGYIQGVYLLGTGLIQGSMICETETELDDAALVMSTSGTTGLPKCAIISHENLQANLSDIAAYLRLGVHQTILICRPLYHCAVLTGEFLISILKGVNIFFYDGVFQPRIISRKMIERNITVFGGTPTILYHLCRSVSVRKVTLPLQKIIVSGECMTDLTAAMIINTLPDSEVYHVYGLTEASPRVAYLPPDLFRQYPLAVGVPLRSVEVKIVDTNGEQVPQGTYGLIMVKGPNVMKGYYRNETDTDRALCGGWLNTNDIGYIGSNGLLFVKGRADGMIIRAGLNVYPQEIENKLLQDPDISDAIVMGIKDRKGGDRIHVGVVPANRSMTAEDVYHICQKSLPGYLMPDYIELMESIPQNSSGKKIRRNGVKNSD